MTNVTVKLPYYNLIIILVYKLIHHDYMLEFYARISYKWPKQPRVPYSQNRPIEAD